MNHSDHGGESEDSGKHTCNELWVAAAFLR